MTISLNHHSKNMRQLQTCTHKLSSRKPTGQACSKHLLTVITPSPPLQKKKKKNRGSPTISNTVAMKKMYHVAATWIHLESLILPKSERGQILYDITYTWNLKYGTGEPIYRTETDSQT